MAHYSVVSSIVTISSISGSAPSMNKLDCIEYINTLFDFDLIYFTMLRSIKMKCGHVIVFISKIINCPKRIA